MRSLAAGAWLSLFVTGVALGCSSEGDGSDASQTAAGGEGAGAAGGAAGAGTSGGTGATSAGPCAPEAGRCSALPPETERPFRPSEHSAVYAQEQRQLIVFGGSQAVPVECNFPTPLYVDETWIYDDPCGQWHKVEASGPRARGRHAAAWGDGVMWVFGGRDLAPISSAPNAPYYSNFNDLWYFDIATKSWTEVSAQGDVPSPRANASLNWDGKRGLLWLFGGNSGTEQLGYTPEGDLYSFAPDTSTWTRHDLPGAPPARLFHATALDSTRDELVLFGGANSAAVHGSVSYFSDLWVLDLEELEWQPVQPLDARPRGRFWPSLVVEPTGSYLVFGGHDDAELGNRNDTWRFDRETSAWSPLLGEDTYVGGQTGLCEFPPDFADVDVSLPERRSSQTMVWSEGCGHALLYGGKTDCGTVDDLWQLDGQGWTLREPATEGEVCLRWRSDPSLCSNLCS